VSNLPLILPAILCGIGGLFFGASVVADMHMPDTSIMWKSALACVLCWIGAGVCLAAVVWP
jgi:predicted tellurium resistance membrane protein TerC